MATETNRLVLNVQSDSVRRGSDRLDRFSRSAGIAATASTKMAMANNAQAAATSKASIATSVNTASTRANAVAATAESSANALNTKVVLAELVAISSNTAATATNTAASTAAATATKAQTVANTGLTASFLAMVAPLAAILGPLLLIKKAFSSTVELQDFEAQLKTATGSAEGAAIAFGALEDFATTTPFQLESSLNAFIKLTNLGLEPSEAALKSYGNTAAALGEDLVSMVEAVAKATVGEFESLKRFGILARNEGDTIRFTFRGVTTVVKNTSEEIEGYLQNIGNVEFAGAMAERMATVGGQVSNFGDLWNQLFRTISEMGVGSVIAATLQIGIDALTALIGYLESGRFKAAIDTWTVAFQGWSEAFSDTLSFITDLFGLSSQDWSDLGGTAFETLIKVAQLAPAQITKIMQRIGVEIGAISLYAEAAGTAMVVTFIEFFKGLLDSAKSFGKAVGAALNPFDDEGFLESFKNGFDQQVEITKEAARKIAAAYTQADEKIEATRQARIETIGEIQTEFDATVAQIEKLGLESDNLKAKYEAELQAKNAARASGDTTDRTAQFEIEGEEGPTRQEAKEFERLMQELKNEEELIEESYQKRLDLIRVNTKEGSMVRAELEEKVKQEYEKDLIEFREKQIEEIDILKSGFDFKLLEIDAYYNTRRDIILSNERTTEEEKTALVLANERERNAILVKMQSSQFKQGLKITSDYLTNFTGLAKSSNKDLANIGKTALVAQKGIAIAQATMKTYEGATSAYASLAGIPVVGPALGAAAAAAVVAAGVANVAQIASTPVNVGSFASGGIIGGSSFSGDQLQANVNSGEMILNAQQQRRLFNIADGKNNSNSNYSGITIINNTPAQITTEESNDGEAKSLKILVNEVDRQLANGIDAGSGQLNSALQRSFNLKRG